MRSHKPKSKRFADSYFSFSRSQRRSMFMLIMVAGMVAGFTKWKEYSISNKNEDIGFSASVVQASLEPKNPLKQHRDNQFAAQMERQSYFRNRSGSAPLVLSPAYFDPNTVSLDQLIRLGFPKRAAENLVRYRQKGGRFGSADDLEKIYGLGKAEAEMLKPWVKIDRAPVLEKESSIELALSPAPEASPVKRERMIIPKLEVNLADSFSWQMLPGIGAKRASAIMRYREKLGGFISVEQVGETFALPDSVFQKIKPNLVLENTAIRQLPLNTATESELKAHPYIGWQWAKIIVAYRTQHGPFQSVDDLLNIHIIRKDWLEKVRPYLGVEKQ